MLVPERVITDMYYLCSALDGLLGNDLEPVRKRIEAFIESKVDARERRDNFTAYKNAQQGSPAREEARRKYLENAGIPEEVQSAKEISFYDRETSL
jgi:hypothetical protein